MRRATPIRCRLAMFSDMNRERDRGAPTSALLRRRGRGAALRPRRRAPAHRAATAVAADPPLRGRARGAAVLPDHAQRRARSRRRGAARARAARSSPPSTRPSRTPRRAARGEYGRLAIGFTGSSTYAMLPSLAAAMRDELPGVVLDLRGELLTPAQVARLLDGTLDLGLLRPPVHERELSTEVLHSEPLLRRPPGVASARRRRRGPARAARGRAVRHLPVALPLRRARRRRGRLRGPRLQARRGARGGGDRDARELRRRRPRRLARPGLRAQHDRRGSRLPPARSRRHSRRARRRVATRRSNVPCSCVRST